MRQDAIPWWSVGCKCGAICLPCPDCNAGYCSHSNHCLNEACAKYSGPCPYIEEPKKLNPIPFRYGVACKCGSLCVPCPDCQAGRCPLSHYCLNEACVKYHDPCPFIEDPKKLIPRERRCSICEEKVGREAGCKKCGFQVRYLPGEDPYPLDTRLYESVQEFLRKGEVVEATQLLRKSRGLIFEDAKDFRDFCREWGMTLPGALILENVEPKAWRAGMAISPWRILESYQEQFDKEVRFGLLFSLLWVFGVGSVVGIVMGVRAFLTMMEAAREVGRLQEKMVGVWKLWLCFALGVVGLVLAVVLGLKFLK